MIAQSLLFLFWQALGICLGLPFKKRLPVSFLALSGFLWGALAWALLGLFYLGLGLPYNLISMLGGLSALCAAILISLFRRRITWNAADLGWIGGSLSLSGLLTLTLSQFNASIVSPDSLIMIMNGRAFIANGFAPELMSELSLRGVFLPLLQSASKMIGIDYLWALQPVFTLNLLALFVYAGLRMLRPYAEGGAPTALRPNRVGAVLVGLGALAVCATTYLVFQSVYIHNNLPSALYWLGALVCLWLSGRENNPFWIIPAAAALLAFSLLRAEAPLFALALLAVFLNTTQLSARFLRRALYPMLAITAAWYLYLLVHIGQGSFVLDPLKIGLILACLLGFGLLLTILDTGWMQKWLVPHLSEMILILILLGGGALYLWDPQTMHNSTRVLWINMLETGLWGPAWVLLLFLFGLALTRPAFYNARLFNNSLLIFFCALWVLSSRNQVFQLDWGDSANRMLTHIYPACWLYLAVLFGQPIQQNKQPNANRFWLGLFCLVLLAWVLLALSGK